MGTEVIGVVPGAPGRAAVMQAVGLPTVTVADTTSCQVRYRGTIFGVSAGSALDAAHYASAGAVSFARGLNDTPKIAAVLLVGNALAPGLALVAVGAVRRPAV